MFMLGYDDFLAHLILSLNEEATAIAQPKLESNFKILNIWIMCWTIGASC